MIPNSIIRNLHSSHGQQGHRDWPYRRPLLQRYGFAVLAVVLACLLRYLVQSEGSMRFAFTFFVPAAMLAVWYGGLGPGIAATLGGLAAGLYFILEPRPEPAITSREAIGITVYTLTTMICVGLCEHLHLVIRRLEHAFAHERHDEATAKDRAAVAKDGSPFKRAATARYGLAIGVVALAFALRYFTLGTQDTRFPFIFFVPAALVATWYGGMAPGMLATLLGLMLGDYFFLSEHQGMGTVREGERLAIGLYAATTTLSVMLIENLHVRIQRTEHAIEHARHGLHKTNSATGSAPG